MQGPPGTGKTTSILCLARELLGDSFDESVMELNASDERGIDIVRSKITLFARKQVPLPPGRHKIVILDEADRYVCRSEYTHTGRRNECCSMTTGAQQALRVTMEKHNHSTRFALACNQSSKVIEAVQSRCAMLAFVRLPDDQILAQLRRVASLEQVGAGCHLHAVRF